MIWFYDILRGATDTTPETSLMPRLLLTSTTPTVSIEGSRSFPNKCLLFVAHDVLAAKKPTIIFPEVDSCFMLVGQKGNTYFFGHFSPLTATDGIENEVGKIVSEISARCGEEKGEGKADLFFMRKNDNDNEDDDPHELVTFRNVLQKGGLRVISHGLNKELSGNTFAFDTSDDVIKVVENYEQCKGSPMDIGVFSDALIGTIEG